MARTGHTHTRFYTKVCICRRRFDQQQPAQTTARIILQVAPMQHWKAVRCRKWRSHCSGWSRPGLGVASGEAITVVSCGGNRLIKEQVEDRRGRDQCCSSGAACVLMLHGICMASDYVTTKQRDTYHASYMPPCNPPLPYNNYTIILSETPSYFLLLSAMGTTPRARAGPRACHCTS